MLINCEQNRIESVLIGAASVAKIYEKKSQRSQERVGNLEQRTMSVYDDAVNGGGRKAQ